MAAQKIKEICISLKDCQILKKRKLNVIQLATLSYSKQKCPFVTRNQFSKETG